ncbi:hypothetical protein G6011_04267 [Alternaria panax]|uniref:Uncharacterized protein n=1 Tax=Alternaria panax TaxID=48097 RepID=A0AAD4IG68_9PLEO|nr:hypothetical protein G6011_04267 [Alternaria panax]
MKTPRPKLISKRPDRSSPPEKEVNMMGFGGNDDDDGDYPDNIDVQTVEVTGRRGEGRAYVNTAQDADSGIVDPDDENLEHQRIYKGKGKVRAGDDRFTKSNN